MKCGERSVDHIGLRLLGILATVALVLATLHQGTARTMPNFVAGMIGRSTVVGGNTAHAYVRERCKDPHKHSGCDTRRPL